MGNINERLHASMSDKRRSSFRVSGKKAQSGHKSRTATKQSSPTSTINSEERGRQGPPDSRSNKRSRVDSTSLRKVNSKKKKEIIYDDGDDNVEVPSNEKAIKTTEMDRCAICLDDFTEPKQLDKCSHTFCTACIDQYFETVKPQCPCCFTIYGEMRGNQPVDGTMVSDTVKHRLPGFEHDSQGTIRITYHFRNGIQDSSQPNPGAPYYGTTRQAYLPDNREGRHVHELLKKAFQLRQIFTVGQSRTTGYENVVTWNDIHHKTSVVGGVENFGYPDATYLNRVKQELAAKGIQ